MDKVSYALGLSVAGNLLNSGVTRIEFNDFMDGVKTVFTGSHRELKISPEEANKILDDYFSKIKEEKDAQNKKEREENLKIANDYLNENKSKEGVQSTESGLQYKVITSVESDEPIETPTSHSRVKCHYEGKLVDGSVFDSSYKRGEPATFSLEQVIPGWTEGLQLMSVGEKYEFTIPPQLGYGEVGIPGHIPGNSVLIFTVELLEIVK